MPIFRYESIDTDEILFDPLPQPYRYINKLLLRCIGDAIDLAEGGGSAASLQAIVGHNLKLEKVGKLPTEQAGSFFLSTAIAAQKITVYRLLVDTHYLIADTTQGRIVIFDPVWQSVVYTLGITSLSKFAAVHLIHHLNCLETNYSNYVVTFVTDELSYLLFLSSSFAFKTAIELDLSFFLLDSRALTSCQAPFLVITDGTGRTAIYNCHTPAELVPDEGQSNAASAKANKVIQLEPI
jgi:hypothetical protein